MEENALSFLDDEHPVYTEWKATWARMERLMRGGHYVKDELTRFEWEAPIGGFTPKRSEAAVRTTSGRKDAIRGGPENEMPLWQPGEHYSRRQRQAIYMNFPEMFAVETVGQIFRQAPKADEALNFGSLGTVKRPEGASGPSIAEVLYYNIDGVGNDGSMWNNYWAASMRKAVATGHRWHFAEMSTSAPTTVEDVIRGKRPYLIELSPLKVPTWEFDRGQLQYAIIRRRSTKLTSDGGAVRRKTGRDYLLLVMQGYKVLDSEMRRAAVTSASIPGRNFSEGGWWHFDSEKKLIASGDWSKTNGEIPMGILFYDRDDGADDTDSPNGGIPAISRPGVMEIGNAAIAHMNLSSAVHFEIWDAAKGITFLAGVDVDGFNIAMNKIGSGNRYVPLAFAKDKTSAPAVQTGDSVSAPQSNFETRLRGLRDEIKDLMAQEELGALDSSGASKNATYQARRSPRLSLMASEGQSVQNTMLAFICRRLGKTPDASVRWPDSYELIDWNKKVSEFLRSQTESNVSSPTATAKALTRMATDAGLVADDKERSAIEKEFQESAEAQSLAVRQGSALDGLFGGTLRGSVEPPPNNAGE